MADGADDVDDLMADRADVDNEEREEESEAAVDNEEESEAENEAAVDELMSDAPNIVDEAESEAAVGKEESGAGSVEESGAAAAAAAPALPPAPLPDNTFDPRSAWWEQAAFGAASDAVNGAVKEQVKNSAGLPRTMRVVTAGLSSVDPQSIAQGLFVEVRLFRRVAMFELGEEWTAGDFEQSFGEGALTAFTKNVRQFLEKSHRLHKLVHLRQISVVRMSCSGSCVEVRVRLEAQNTGPAGDANQDAADSAAVSRTIRKTRAWRPDADDDEDAVPAYLLVDTASSAEDHVSPPRPPEGATRAVPRQAQSAAAKSSLSATDPGSDVLKRDLRISGLELGVAPLEKPPIGPEGRFDMSFDEAADQCRTGAGEPGKLLMAVLVREVSPLNTRLAADLLANVVAIDDSDHSFIQDSMFLLCRCWGLARTIAVFFFWGGGVATD
jgi:hypothetical protein